MPNATKRAVEKAEGAAEERPLVRPNRAQPASTAGLADAKLMLIHDDPAVLGALRHALLRAGATTIHSHPNALRALSEIIGGERAVDLIFCDLRMPHMDGVEFFRRLAEIEYRGGLVLVSGEDGRLVEMTTKLARVRKLNLLGHLQKPIDGRRLEELLARWCRPAPRAEAIQGAPISAAELKQAIADHELINFYQPQVAVATGAVVGVEALLRWRRRGEGIITPGRFIAAAESEGLIERITRYVIHHALAQGRVWRDLGLRLAISINVTMDDLAQLDFPEFLSWEADSAAIQPSSVVLEVTERRLMADPMAVFDVLTRLRMKGFRLSIDDFGTGYSSLAQLRDIAFDEIKVDVSFIHGAAENAKLRAIVEASRSIAQQLEMTMVAEGVEDRADWEFVRGARCDVAQGYFVAAPMPAENVADGIADWYRRLPDLFLGSLLK